MGTSKARAQLDDSAEAAFGAEAATHLPQLRRAGIRLAGNQADADDLVQDAYLRALSAATRFRPGTNLGAWLFTILRNLSRNRQRDARRLRLHLEDGGGEWIEQHPSRSASPEQLLLQQSVAPALQRALESMPKALRDAVWLRDVEGLTYAEMAARLRIPLGTVMSRISRGRRVLHDRLTGHEEMP